MTIMDIVVIDVKLGLLVGMDENMGEIQVNLELHQKEKARSILL
ncbi:hypothetical protein Goshw_004834 [Gossypium schwendimanii]|uniref:Uncharacterized protein n=1 Tax=Gossypium schwendimanii TaxID=34291 RepID=A0A7J9NFV0_GOSSC|nr:hypothetical protein [Gossypium schwendimanii]